MDPVHAPTKDHHDIGFVLLPGFSLLAFSSALDSLRMANHLADRRLFKRAGGIRRSKSPV